MMQTSSAISIWFIMKNFLLKSILFRLSIFIDYLIIPLSSLTELPILYDTEYVLLAMVLEKTFLVLQDFKSCST